MTQKSKTLSHHATNAPEARIDIGAGVGDYVFQVDRLLTVRLSPSHQVPVKNNINNSPSGSSVFSTYADLLEEAASEVYPRNPLDLGVLDVHRVSRREARPEVGAFLAVLEASLEGPYQVAFVR